MTSPSTWTYTLKYSIHTDYCKQTATDLNKECCNFISRVNGCSSFFSCQFPEKVPQKAVFLCEKSCQNSSRNSCAFFIYFWCRIINNAQPTMKTRFLQNTFIGEEELYFTCLFTAGLFPFHSGLPLATQRVSLSNSLLTTERGLSLTRPKHRHFSNSHCSTFCMRIIL